MCAEQAERRRRELMETGRKAAWWPPERSRGQGSVNPGCMAVQLRSLCRTSRAPCSARAAVQHPGAVHHALPLKQGAAPADRASRCA